jgi:hypothetical protein
VSFAPHNPGARGGSSAPGGTPHLRPADAAAAPGQGLPPGQETLQQPPGPGTPGATEAAAAPAKNARKAHLRLARFDPWSVMKFSFVMSLVCFVILFVAVGILYALLAGLGVFSSLETTVQELGSEQGGGNLDAGGWFSPLRIMGYTALLGALNVLLITALSTVGAVIYNSVADIVGGVEVTLKESE